MKFGSAATVVLSLGSNAEASPVGKVISMLSDLEHKIIGEGEVAQKEYEQFAEWCEDRSRNLGFEIKTGKSEVENLDASIAQEESTIRSLTTKVEELVGAIATNDADLKAATEIRSKEATDFSAEEKNLMETIDMLRRATSILEREMNGGASMMQLKNADNLAQALDVMVKASLIETGDASKLTAFVQQSNSDDDVGAPAGTVYASHSGGIVETLQDLSEKAESQLADTRKRETTSQNNFEMLRQSLVDETKFATKTMDEAKKGIAASSEKKSTAEGDHQVTSKDLSEDVTAKGSLHQDCMSKASIFEAETKSRGEELRALAEAKKIIRDSTSAAVSLVQVSLSSSRDLDSYEAVRLVRDLAHKQNSGALVQLASQMSAAMHTQDAFDKVKGLISDMIAKLESQADQDATKKAYCDKELAETNEKKSDKTDEIHTMTTRIDRMAATSAQLKEEVATLQNQLAKLAKSQAEMDKFRQEDKATNGESKAVLEQGLAGLKAALKILNEYYGRDDHAHEAAEGAGNGIISLLEVCEADFSKNLAEVNSDEDTAVYEYEKETKENEIEKTRKEADVSYKSKESKSLDKFAAELNSDRAGVKAELDAVLEYLAKIEEQCIAKAETYADRSARRLAEIEGLKHALQVLETETALVQSWAGHKTLRGSVH